LHLHPVNETHQLRPTLTYLDVLSRKTRRHVDDESDSDAGPPPDPEEPVPPPPPPKEKKPVGDAKDVQVAAKKTDEKGLQGGFSSVRRDMLKALHDEEDEQWTAYSFFDSEVRPPT